MDHTHSASSSRRSLRMRRAAIPGLRSGRVLLLGLGALAIGVVALTGWAMFGREGGGDGSTAKRDVFVVKRGEFNVVVPASGELAADRQIEIVNKLESKAVVTMIVPEGSRVDRDSVLFTLADEEIKNKIKDAEDVVNTAQASLTAAKSTLEVKRSTGQSEEAKAMLTIRLAELALEAWRDGEEKAKRDTLEVKKETTSINYERLVRKHVESQKLQTDGHISMDELEQDRIAMIEASAALKTATLDLEVYKTYTYLQDKAKKESDLEQAQAELVRVRQRNEAEVSNAESGVTSALYKVQSAQDRLTDLQQQLTYCTVRAPQSGLVVYATSIDGGNRWGGGSDRALQVGTELRPNETIIVLPDTSQMVANVKVNEALSGRIRAGQPVTVVSDALPNVILKGTVVSVGVLAESSGWRDPNRRDYTVRVMLQDVADDYGLKPSMRCKSEIVVEAVDDAVHVPIQAVFRSGGSAFVYLSDSGGTVERRDVQTGRASELDVEILAGLDEGDRVLLREPEAVELRGKPREGEKDGAPARKPSGARPEMAGTPAAKPAA